VLQCEETLEAQVSEPRTNSQYHPQHVPGLGEPPKLSATTQSARSFRSTRSFLEANRVPKSAFSHNPFAFNALRHYGRPQ
jgi:hypothetical protein